ncbi:hypothetical protein ACHQM5_013668 [Ranunculus cassubicifolius]
MYQMSCFRIPLIILNKINALQRDFWWGKFNKKCLYLKAWKSLCKSLAQGGIGIRDFILANEAFLSRIVWRLLSHPNNLCSMLIKGKYFPTTKATKVKARAYGSWFWNGCHKGILTILNNAVWDVGDGKNIDLWTEPWIPFENHSLRIFGPRPLNCPNFVSLAGTRDWDTYKLNSFFLPFQERANRNVKIHNSNNVEKLYWGGTKKAFSL